MLFCKPEFLECFFLIPTEFDVWLDFEDRVSLKRCCIAFENYISVSDDEIYGYKINRTTEFVQKHNHPVGIVLIFPQNIGNLANRTNDFIRSIFAPDYKFAVEKNSKLLEFDGYIPIPPKNSLESVFNRHNGLCIINPKLNTIRLQSHSVNVLATKKQQISNKSNVIIVKM